MIISIISPPKKKIVEYLPGFDHIDPSLQHIRTRIIRTRIRRTLLPKDRKHRRLWTEVNRQPQCGDQGDTYIHSITLQYATLHLLYFDTSISAQIQNT